MNYLSMFPVPKRMRQQEYMIVLNVTTQPLSPVSCRVDLGLHLPGRELLIVDALQKDGLLQLGSLWQRTQRDFPGHGGYGTAKICGENPAPDRSCC